MTAQEERWERATGILRPRLRKLGRLCQETKLCFRSLLPEEYWEHRRGARRENLLALRALVDAAIERTERPPKGRPESVEAK